MAAVARSQQQQSMAPPQASTHFRPSNDVPYRPADGLDMTGKTKSSPTLPSMTGRQSQYTPPNASAAEASQTYSASPIFPPNPYHALNRPTGSNGDRAPQIGRPKNVGFVPAALRPTERPRDVRGGHAKAQSIAAVRGGPPTPPRSQHNSYDGAGPAANAGTGSGHSSRKSSNSSHGSNKLAHKLTPIEIPASVNPTVFDAPPTPRPGTRGSLLSPTTTLSSLSLSSLGAQQAPHPTKAHWTPDAMVTKCTANSCSTDFTMFRRRHHCRRCGQIFCHVHAARTVPLDVDARMVPLPASTASSVNPLGSAAATPEDETPGVGWWRSCEECYNAYVNWMNGLRGQPDDIAGMHDRLQLPVPQTGRGDRNDSVAGSMSGSVPQNWNWSTF